MSKRGKASVPKTGPRTRPRPTKNGKQPGNGPPRTAKRDTSLLLARDEVREDIALIQTAVKERWPVPLEKRPQIVRRLLGVVAKESVTVVTKRGEVVDAEAPADTNAVLASRVLVQMVGQNQKDDHRGDPDTVINHNEQHITVVNGTERPVDPAAEQRRSRLLALAQSLRASSLVIDGDAVGTSPASGVDRDELDSTPKPAGEGN
jgi:hypothetical protein